MNRRQRKKQFKKLYGMNPEQYKRWMKDHWKEIMIEAIARSETVIREGFDQIIREVTEALPIIYEGIHKLIEEAWVAVKTIEVHNLQEGEKSDGKDDIDT